ncbi:E3 ubiquitin-protein ligase [Corchorus olitorius]|uniref:E3 ubiquitin-protein ligase n=1 Tax=Corchorus olitorius TaxID=93759 RepID=A0A1R3KQE7_9ROSI|nr:E3 ubiquitin-protein ligase [Corchorus olitorius]
MYSDREDERSPWVKANDSGVKNEEATEDTSTKPLSKRAHCNSIEELMADRSHEINDGSEDSYVSCEEVDIEVNILEDNMKWLERSVVVLFNAHTNIVDVAATISDFNS